MAKPPEIGVVAADIEATAQKGPQIIQGSALERWTDNTLKGGSTHAGPDVLAAYLVKGAALLERGVTEFTKWSSEMIKEYGPRIRPQLKQIYDQAVKTRRSTFTKGPQDASRMATEEPLPESEFAPPPPRSAANPETLPEGPDPHAVVMDQGGRAAAQKAPRQAIPARSAKRVAVWAVSVIALIFWFVYVWPTPWRYYKSGSKNLRVNRFTGTTEVLGNYGWIAESKDKPSTSPFIVGGVLLDLPKLRLALDGCPPEARAYLDSVYSLLRYGQYERALSDLEELAKSPGLTDGQRRIAIKVAWQMKQIVQAVGPTR